MQAIQFKDKQLEYNANHPDPKTDVANDVLMAVSMAGICSTDLEIVKGYMDFSGIPGHEFVGKVQSGPRELIGKRAVAEINCVCGKCDLCLSGLSNHCSNRSVIGIDKHDGVFAEYVAVPARNVHVIPDSITDDAAVFIEPLAAAFQIIQQINIEQRHKTLVLGDGRLGMLVVQVLATVAKPGNLVIVGKHEEKLTFAEKRGIQGILLKDMLIKPAWDLVVDCTGSDDGFNTACQLVKPRGKLVLKSTFVPDNPVNLAPLVINEITLTGSRCGPFPNAINALAARQIETNGLITSRYKLSEAANAFAAANDRDQIKVVFDLKK